MMMLGGGCAGRERRSGNAEIFNVCAACDSSVLVGSGESVKAQTEHRRGERMGDNGEELDGSRTSSFNRLVSAVQRLKKGGVFWGSNFFRFIVPGRPPPSSHPHLTYLGFFFVNVLYFSLPLCRLWIFASQGRLCSSALYSETHPASHFCSCIDICNYI